MMGGRVRDRVPHAVDGAARRALEGPLQLRKPLRECHVVQLAHHVHSAVEVDQRAHLGVEGGGA